MLQGCPVSSWTTLSWYYIAWRQVYRVLLTVWGKVDAISAQRCCIILTQLLSQQHMRPCYPLEGLGKNWMYWVGSQSHHPSVQGHFQVAHNVHLMSFPWAVGRLGAIKQDTTKHCFVSVFPYSCNWLGCITEKHPISRSGSHFCWNVTQLSWPKGLDNVSLHHRETNDSPTLTPTDNLELSFNLVRMSLKEATLHLTKVLD